mmetsp:Transcript_14092/g.32501  ORF Transcript_14092/g.32501 Transcript_14092/m.32501 type:complete len:209 (-) Transcript_14092:776-1402(-)
MDHLCPEDNVPCRKPVEEALGVDGVEEQGAEELVITGGEDSHELSERPGPGWVNAVVDLQHDAEVLVDDAVVLLDVVNLSVEVEGEHISVLSSELSWNKRELGGDLLVGIQANDHAEARAEGDVVVRPVEMSSVEHLIRSVLDGVRSGNIDLVHPIQHLNLRVGSKMVLVQVGNGGAIGNPVKGVLRRLLQALLSRGIRLGGLVPPVS